MKVPRVISVRILKIVQKKRFVKDILDSIIHFSGKTLLVGGAVRDLFLDLPIQDLDFEVYGLTLDQLQTILQQYGTVSLIGKSFGVLRLHGVDIDWSLPRKDSAGRHPVVAYDPAMNYEQSFARRDVTINAMGIDMQTFELIDPYHGLQDLKDKLLRATDTSFFAQDPLRLLRVMQFTARFDMQVDPALTELCSGMDMKNVSQERIEQEFKKLFLQSQKPSIGLQWLCTIKKFHEFLPGIIVDESLWNCIDVAAQQKYSNDNEKLAIMWAVIGSYLSAEKNVNSFQHLDNNHQQMYKTFFQNSSTDHDLVLQSTLLILYGHLLVDHQNLTDVQIKWLAVWLWPKLSIRLLLNYVTIRYGTKRLEKLLENSQRLQVYNQPEKALLTGKDFIEIAAGSKLGQLVKKAYELQLNEGITDRDVLKNKVITFRY